MSNKYQLFICNTSKNAFIVSIGVDVGYLASIDFDYKLNRAAAHIAVFYCVVWAVTYVDKTCESFSTIGAAYVVFIVHAGSLSVHWSMSGESWTRYDWGWEEYYWGFKDLAYTYADAHFDESAVKSEIKLAWKIIQIQRAPGVFNVQAISLIGGILIRANPIKCEMRISLVVVSRM